jgi:beta-lactamase class A
VPLADEVREILRGRPGAFGVYARNVTTGERVEVDADVVMPTESAAKTFILVHYARGVEAGVYDPTERVSTADEDRALGSGVLRYLSSGIALTLDDLAWLMIIISDNVATRMLLRSVGGADAINATMGDLGLRTARLNPAFDARNMLEGRAFGTSTARDLAEIYTHLDERCRSILFRQQHQSFLPRRLPHSGEATDFGFTMPLRVFNKTGGGVGNCTDSGRFETDTAAWVVAAMATGQTDFASRPDDAAPAAFAKIGELLFAAWGGEA